MPPDHDLEGVEVRGTKLVEEAASVADEAEGGVQTEQLRGREEVVGGAAAGDAVDNERGVELLESVRVSAHASEVEGGRE